MWVIFLKCMKIVATPSGKNYDAVLSDMAPATTGRKDIDAARSQALCEVALAKALELLKHGGHFVCKIFQGSGFKIFEKQVCSSILNSIAYLNRKVAENPVKRYIS